jgi:hypothetical protein
MGGLITIEDSNNHEVSFTPKDGASPRTVTIPDNVPDLDVDNTFVGNVEASSMSISGDFVSTRSFKNRLINGGFDIWQRGTTFAAAGFAADRWRAGGATSQDRVDATGTGHLYGLKITNAGAGANTGQPIELPETGDTIMFSLGSTWTVSFWAKGLAAGDLTCKMLGRDASSSVVNEVTLVDGSQVGVLTTAWQKFVITMTTTADIGATNTCMHLLLGSSDEFSIAGVQLEEGSVATPFEQRPIGYEDSLCKRYYQTFYLSAYSLHSTGRSNSASIVSGNNTFLPIRMRTTPTITQSATISDGAVKGISLSYSGTGSVYVTAVNPYSIQFRSQGASLVNGAYYAIGTNATGASAYLDAEL